MMTRARSYLYIPGDRTDLLAKASRSGADALIVDLEDAVAPQNKQRARKSAQAFLSDHDPQSSDTAIWVRIDPNGDPALDLDAIVMPGLSGICVAKTENARDVTRIATFLDDLERARHIAPRSVQIAPLLESAAAVLNAVEIAAGPRVARLQIGEADLSAAVGIEPDADALELLWARSQVVFASAAAGIDPPVGPVSTDFRDLDAFRTSTVALKRLGYRGRACIHPAQVVVVNEVFTPTEDEVRKARELVTRFEAARAVGDAVITDADGRMVDLAVVRAALRVLTSRNTPDE